MPPGYGYRYTPNDYWWLNYMIHNLTAKPFKVSITYDVDIVPTDDAPPGGMKDVHPIWMDVQNGSVYPVFDVLKGTGADGTFTYPDEATDPYAGGQPKNEWTVYRAGRARAHLRPPASRRPPRRPRSGAATARTRTSSSRRRSTTSPRARCRGTCR